MWDKDNCFMVIGNLLLERERNNSNNISSVVELYSFDDVPSESGWEYIPELSDPEKNKGVIMSRNGEELIIITPQNGAQYYKWQIFPYPKEIGQESRDKDSLPFYRADDPDKNQA